MAFAVWLTLLAVPVIVLDNFPQPGAGASQPVATEGSQGSTTAHAVTVVTAAPPVALHTTMAPPATAPSTTAAPTTAPAAPTTAAPPADAVMTLTQAPAEPPAAPEPPTTEPPPAEAVNAEEGGASWYRYIEGTCAHRTLPRGTVVTVTNLATGASTQCTVADRGPYIDGRVIDLDASVFDDLAPLSSGVIDVRITW